MTLIVVEWVIDKDAKASRKVFFYEQQTIGLSYEAENDRGNGRSGAFGWGRQNHSENGKG
jgi:hypothetical protein